MYQNDQPFRRKQIRGGIGAAVALVCVCGATYLGRNWIPTQWLPPDQPLARLLFAVEWLLVPGLCLLVGIQAAAGRGFFPDAIDGTRTPESRSLEITLRYNQNTIEQLLLAAIAWTGLAIAAPFDALYLIPVMAILFGIGRVAFWIGYLMTPIDRAFGMVWTALPSLGAMLWLAYHWLIG